MTEADICRLALDHIGAKSITSLTELSTEAQVCNRLYPMCRDQVLRDYPWAFAQVHRTLAEITVTNKFGFEYAYQYPTDCVRALYIYRVLMSASPIAFKVASGGPSVGKLIFTNQYQAELVYTFKCDNAYLYDDSFIAALSYRLASELVMPITKNAKLVTPMQQLYQAQISSAAVIDSQEGQMDAVNHFTTFTDARG